MFKFLLFCVLSGVGLSAAAQFRVEVSGIGLTQLPIAVATFRGEDAVQQKIASIVQADLERSGQFRGVDTNALVLDETSRPEVSVWRQKNADALLVGSVTRLADGRFDVRVRLWDIVRGQDQGGQSYIVTAAELRLAAHRISDFVYETLTGEKGVFATRIVYITKNPKGYHVWIADADGEGAQSALSSPEPIISPSWSPSGNQLAYVSFESRKPVVYVHDIATGKRRLVANFKGSNSAPTWSPDGKSIAMTLSRDGGSQLYSMDAGGGEAKRLAQSNSIDTEPTFTADGKTIYFVSDRGGSPQIYRMPSTGGTPERVTFSGSYNVSPALSTDGRWLAYIARVNGAFKLTLMDIASGASVPLTDTSADEKPSFSPNSKLIIYATLFQGKEALMTTTLDGKVKARLSGQSGDIREPGWGPSQRLGN